MTQNNPEPKSVHSSRGRMFFILLVVTLIAGGGVGAYWELIGSKHVTTDNAYVGAEIAQVAAAVGGTVKTVNVTDTQTVKTGDILVIIDDTDTKIALAHADANVAQAQTNLERAQIDLERRTTLSTSGSVSGEELSNAQNAFKSAEAAMTVAKATRDQAQIDLDRTVIRAPIDGVIARREVQLGQRVSIGTPLLSIVPVTDVHVDANFKEVQLRNVKIGQPVKLTADIYGSNVVYHGTVAGLSGGTGSTFSVIPAQNATGNWIKVVQRLPVRIKLDPAELAAHPLQVGLSMYVDIDISGKK